MLANRVRMGSQKEMPFVDRSGGAGKSTTIVGNGDLGFFGEHNYEGFYTPGQLGFFAGMDGAASFQGNDINWFKFVLDGKIMRIPKKPIYINISWNALNSLGLVYGKRLERFGIAYNVRLMTEKEWNNLMYSIHEDTHPDFAGYTDGELHLGFDYQTRGHMNWLQDTIEEKAIAKGSFGVESSINAPKGNAGNNFGWRPIIEQEV